MNRWRGATAARPGFGSVEKNERERVGEMSELGEQRVAWGGSYRLPERGVEQGRAMGGEHGNDDERSTASAPCGSAATGSQRRFYRTLLGILFTITNKSLLLFLFETSRF